MRNRSVPEGLTDMKRLLSGGGTRGFLVLMRYASLDRLCQMGMKRKPARPLETQEQHLYKAVAFLRASTYSS